MSDPGFVTIPALDATGAQRNIRFWSDDGAQTGNLTPASQPQQFAPTPPTPFPSTIAGNVTYTSGVIASTGFSRIAVGLTLSQAGELTISRYLDEEGAIKAGPDQTQALVADTPEVLNLHDGVLFASFQISIANSAGTGATLADTAILLGA